MGTFCAHKNDKIDSQIANYMGITPYLAFLLRLGYATYSGENKDIIDEIYNNPEVTIGNKIIKTKTLEEKLQQISNLLSSYLRSSDYMTAAINLQSTNLVATFENLFNSIKGGTNRLDCIDTIALLFMDFATRLLGKYGGSIQEICNNEKHGTSYILYKMKSALTAMALGNILSFKVGDAEISINESNEELVKALARNFEAVACFALVKLHNLEGLKFNKNLNVVEEDDLITANKNQLEQLHNFEESIRESWQTTMEYIAPTSTVGRHVRAALSGLKKYNLVKEDDELKIIAETNPFGLYRHENISSVHQLLMTVLRGMKNSEDMINKLKNYVARSEDDAVTDREVSRVSGRLIKDILKRLTVNKAYDDTLDNEAHLDYINVIDMLKAAFYSDLKRNKTEYSEFILDRMKNGIVVYKRSTINRSNVHTDLFENFLAMVKLGCVYNSKSTTSIHNEDKLKALQNVKNTIKDIDEFGSARESITARISKLLKILENLGIDCNTNQVYRLATNKNFIEKLKNFGKHGLGLIVKVEQDNKGHFKNAKDFFENRETRSLTDKVTDKRYNKVMSQFREVLFYFKSDTEGSILDAGLYKKDGKFVRMYTDVTPSYMADRIEEFKDAVENNSITQLRDIIKKRYLRNAIYVDMDKNGIIKDINGNVWDEKSKVAPAIKNQWLRLLWNSALTTSVRLDDGTVEILESDAIAEDSFAKKLNWNRILGNVKGKDGIEIDATDFADFDITKHAVAMIRNFLHYSEINAAKGPKSTAFADFPVFILGDANVFKSIRGPRVNTTKDDWVDILYEIYELERARLNLFEKTNEKLEKEGYQKVENTYKKGKDEDGKDIEENATEYVYLKFINEYNKTHTTKFENLSIDDKKKEIKAAIDKEVALFLQRMRAIGVYEIQERDNKHYSQFKNYSSEEALDRLMRDFYINNKIATIQLFLLMTVDIGYYKNSKDLQKRYKEIHAPGNEMDVYAKWNNEYILGRDENGKPIVARKGMYFKDIEVNAEEYDPDFMEVIALLEGLRIVKPNKSISEMNEDEINKIKDKGRKSKIYEDYKKCTYTDGQSFITIHTMRKIMVMQGKWNKDLENKYNQIVSLSKAINNAKTDEEKVKLQSLIINLGTVFQPVKPYGFGHEQYAINDGVTALIPVQYKCAEAVIIPALLPENSKLRALGEYMEKKGLDYVCSTQCIKVGNFGAVDISQSNAADLSNVLDKAYTHITSWEDYRIQTNVPHHMSGERSMGTQIRKIILSQIKKNKVYSSYFKDLDTGGEGIVLDTKDGPKRKAATGSNIIDLYNSLISCGIYESLQLFKEDIEDPTVFSEILLHNVLSNNRDSLSKLLNYVLNDDLTAFDIELWEGGNAYDAQNLLLSVFRKLVNKQMFEGASLVQVSAWGTKQEDIITDENLTSICDNGNLLYYQCVIPFMFSYTNRFGQKVPLKFQDYCHSDGSFIMSNKTTGDMEYASWKNPNWKEGDSLDTRFLIPKIEVEFKGILDLIAYRIPTERNYSCLNLKVVRCCTPIEGGIIKVPSETTQVAGFDFDIDKLYMLRKAFVEREDATTVQQVWDKAYELIAKDLGYTDYKLLTSKLESALGVKPTKDNPLHKVWDKVPELADYNKNEWFAYAAAALGYDEFRWATYNWKKAPSQQISDNSNVDNITAIKRNNALFHLMRCRLMDPETLQSRTTPGGFKNPKIAGKINRELMYNSESNVYGYDNLVDVVEDEDWNDPEPNWDPTDAYTMLYYNQLNLIASKLIGVFANANTFKQYASVAWSIKLRTPITMMGLSFNDLLNNAEGRDADLTLAEFLAASVDAVKDPVLNYLNLNEHTASVACLLGAIGYNPTEIGVFLNQPIIREAVRDSLKNGTALSKSIKNILDRENREGGVFEKLSFDKFSEEEKLENLSFDVLCDNIRGILDEKANKNWRTDLDETKSQYVVAHQLLECLASANDFTMLVQSTKFTASNSVTSTFGGMYEQLMKLNQFYQGEIQLQDGTLLKNGLTNIEIISKEAQEGEGDIFVPIFNDGNMYDSTLDEYIKSVMRTPFGFEQAMYDANKALLQVIKKYFPYEVDLYKNLRRIASNTKVNGVVSADTIDLLHEYILMSMLKNLPNSPFNPNAIITSDGTEYRSKQYFTTIFPRLFANFIQSTQLSKQYPFLKKFIFREYGEDDNVYYTINVDCNSLAEDFMDDDVILGWDSMMRDSNINVQRMAIDLFFYNFHTGGFRYGYNMFMNLCPNSVKKAIIATIERTLENGEQKDNLIGYLNVLKEIREGKRSNLGFTPTLMLWNFVLENPDNRDFVRTLYGSEKDKDGIKYMFRNAIKIATAEAKIDNSPVVITLSGKEDGENNRLYNALRQGKKMISVVQDGTEEKKLVDVFPVAIQVTGNNGTELYIANYSADYVENYNKPANVAEDKIITYTKVDTVKTRVFDNSDNAAAAMGLGSLGDYYYEDVTKDPSYKQIKTSLGKFVDWYTNEYGSDEDFESSMLKEWYDNLELKAFEKHQTLGDITFIDSKELFLKLKGDPTANYREFIRIVTLNLIDTYYKEEIKNLNDTEKNELTDLIKQASFWNRRQSWNSIDSNISYIINNYMEGYNTEEIDSDYTLQEIKRPDMDSLTEEEKLEIQESLNAAEGLAGNEEAIVTPAGKLSCKSNRRKVNRRGGFRNRQRKED